MKYFYFISLILLVSIFFIFTNLNSNLITLDLFFAKIEGVSVGFSMIFSVLIGAIISLFLQLSRLFKRNSKSLSNNKDENPKPKQIIVALDFDSAVEANSIVKLLDPEIYRLKVGKQLYASEGPKILESLNKQGFDIFLDLKLHDIPNTVYKALKNLLHQKVWMTNIHLLGEKK